MSIPPYSQSQSFKSLIAIGLLVTCSLCVLIGILSPALNALTRSTTPEKTEEKSLLFSEIKRKLRDRLVFVDLQGMISEDPSAESYFGDDYSATGVYRKLKDAAKDDSVKGVLLHINSPGGTVGMSHELYQAVLEVRAKKPIVVSMGDVAASGGYYTASAANKIVANPGTLTASIGVILHSLTYEELLTKKLGVKPVTIKSGRFKDILSPFRNPSSADITLLQDLIDKSYQQFINDVLYARTLDIEDASSKKTLSTNIRAVADGRVVLGVDALKAGLIDAVGTNDDAVALLKKLVAKRYGYSNTDALDFDDKFGKNTPFGWLLSSESTSFIPSLKYQLLKQVNPSSSLVAQELWKPLSLRYANQPLWLMESIQ